MRNKIVFFRVVITLLSIISVLVNFFIVPGFIEDISSQSNANINKIIFTIIVIVTQLPILYSFYQSYRLLIDVTKDNAFSNEALLRLTRIKYSILVVGISYLIGLFTILIIDYNETNIIIVCIILMFITAVIFTFTYLLEFLLTKAFVIKQEHDLTV